MKKPIIVMLMMALGMLVFSACGTSGTENAETAAAEETTAPEAREDDAGKAPADETAENVDQQKRSFAAPAPGDLDPSEWFCATDQEERGCTMLRYKNVDTSEWVCVANCKPCGCTLKSYKNEDGEYVERWIRREFVSPVLGWREVPSCKMSHCPKGLTGPDAPRFMQVKDLQHEGRYV